MRVLKVPGRVIGKKAPLTWRERPQVSLPNTLERLSSILISIEKQREYERLKAAWMGIAKENSIEEERRYRELVDWDKKGDVDRDGRDRAGMIAKPTILTEAEIRHCLFMGVMKLMKGFAIVSLNSDGTITPRSRAYPYHKGFGIN